jgi:hypothetical protein
MKDVEPYLPLVVPGGFVVPDDIAWDFDKAPRSPPSPPGFRMALDEPGREALRRYAFDEGKRVS